MKKLHPMPNEHLLVVCGAHMLDLPLNARLTDRGATFVERTATAPDYRLYALEHVAPPRPGLVRVAPGRGAAIEIEIWALSAGALGEVTAESDQPLAIGTLSVAGGRRVTGFVCEAVAAEGARDITHLRGWRAWIEDPSQRPHPASHR